MSFSVCFDSIVNEKNDNFHIEIMISSAHMLRGMLPRGKILKICANLVRLDETLSNFVRFGMYFNRNLCLKNIDFLRK